MNSIDTRWSFSSEDSVQNIDKDEGAIDGDYHVQGILDVVSTPLGLLNISFQSLNSVLWFLILIARPSKSGQTLLIVILASFKILLFAQKVFFKHNLGALIFESLSLEFVEDEGLSKEWIGDLGPHVFKVDKNW